MADSGGNGLVLVLTIAVIGNPKLDCLVVMKSVGVRLARLVTVLCYVPARRVLCCYLVASQLQLLPR